MPVQPKVLTKTEQACLQSLRFPGMDQRRLSLASPAKGTCSWLFEHPQYQNWFRSGGEGQHSGLFFLTGKPGVGKSVLVNEAFRRASTGKHTSRHRTASFFFNRKGGNLENSTIGLYRSLLVQLLPKSPKHFQRVCELRDDQGCDDTWPEFQLQSILRFMFEDPSEPITFLFIDALDECDDGGRSQVAFWHEITESMGSHVNVCFSKRHFPHVSSGLSPIIDIGSHNSNDLALYVEQRLAFGMVPEDPGRQVLRNELLAKSDGVFLWVALSLDSILTEWDKGKGTRHLLEMLTKVPSELSDLFRHFLESVSSAQKPFTLRFFQWVIFAKPLRVYEWHHIMAFIRKPVPRSLRDWRSSDNYTETEEQLERMIKSVSLGLVEVKTIANSNESQGDSWDSISVRAGAGSLDLERGETRVVQVIHESVREYFLRMGGFHILSPDLDHFGGRGHTAQGHISIMDTCLDYINIKELDALVKARREAAQTEQKKPGRWDTTSYSSDEEVSEALGHITATEFLVPPHSQSSTPHQRLQSQHEERINSKRACDETQIDMDYKRRKASSEVTGVFLETASPDPFDVGEFDDWAQSDPAINIIRWLRMQSMDPLAINWTAAQGLACESRRASSATIQVLEDHPALLSYALTQFFVHARLAQDEGASPVPIIRRLLDGRWDRWVALSEEVPPGINLRACAQSHNLSTWDAYLTPNKDIESISSCSEELEGMHNSEDDDGLGYPTRRERSGSVASFSSASSHTTEVGLQLWG